MLHSPARRRFLGTALATTVGTLACPAIVRASTNQRSLDFYNINTQEVVTAKYFNGSDYLLEELVKVDYIMRDRRSEEYTEMDVHLLDYLWEISRLFGGEGKFQVFCGYRSAATNAALARSNKAVAKHSYHITGQAVDISLEGVHLADLRNAARDLKMGGVGYYPGSGFVHIDTGDVRTW